MGADPYMLAGANPAVQADLDSMLFGYVLTFESVEVKRFVLTQKPLDPGAECARGFGRVWYKAASFAGARGRRRGRSVS